MDTKVNNFEPSSDLIQEDDCDTLILYLPGFTKEQLRVQLTSTRALKISGTRPIGENRRSSFQKDFPMSANCDTNKISAKFEEGILYVRQPKLIIPATPEEDEKEPAREVQQPPVPAEQPAPRTNQQPADGMRTAPGDDNDRRTGVRDSTDKSDQRQAAENNEKGKELKAEEKDKRMYDQDKTTDSVGNDQKANAARTKSQEQGKVSGSNGAKMADKATKKDQAIGTLGDHKIKPAVKPRMPRQMMAMALTVLFAFLLGIYISNLSLFTRKPGN